MGTTRSPHSGIRNTSPPKARRAIFSSNDIRYITVCPVCAGQWAWAMSVQGLWGMSGGVAVGISRQVHSFSPTVGNLNKYPCLQSRQNRLKKYCFFWDSKITCLHILIFTAGSKTIFFLFNPERKIIVILIHSPKVSRRILDLRLMSIKTVRH